MIDIFVIQQILSTSLYLEAPAYGSDPIIGGSASLRFSF
jgi:hypothetical protein